MLNPTLTLGKVFEILLYCCELWLENQSGDLDGCVLLEGLLARRGEECLGVV